MLFIGTVGSAEVFLVACKARKKPPGSDPETAAENKEKWEEARVKLSDVSSCMSAALSALGHPVVCNGWTGKPSKYLSNRVFNLTSTAGKLPLCDVLKAAASISASTLGAWSGGEVGGLWEPRIFIADIASKKGLDEVAAKAMLALVYTVNKCNNGKQGPIWNVSADVRITITSG